MSCNRSIGLISALLVTALASLASGAPQYTITELGTMGTLSHGISVNNSGQVAGWFAVPTSYEFCQHAFLYSGGVMTDLGSPSSNGQDHNSYASSINASGQITGNGYLVPNSSERQAFLYSGGVRTSLGTPYGGYSDGAAINDIGQIAGYAYGPRGNHAVLYSEGSWHDLGTIGGYNGSSLACGINNLGQVTGYGKVAGGGWHAFLYSGDTMQDLGTLGGADSFGYGVNDNGQVAGRATLANGSSRAFLYTNGVMQNLGTIGTSNSAGLAVNASGQVVGYASESAFLYTGGVMYDLNNLVTPGHGWILQFASDISDNGYITGWGINPMGETRAFLLTPVPEPASLTLAALAALALLRRRH